MRPAIAPSRIGNAACAAAGHLHPFVPEARPAPRDLERRHRRRPRTGGVAPGRAQWNLRTLPDRLATLKADPWADYPGPRQSVTADMRRRIGLG
ncbi:hypothetical protein CVV70_01675 [Ralstonia solanacearum]|nr:hypothetical protein CCY86_13345 [Ralstonia solanacearum]OPK49967.1 hypothetical protein B5G54_05775 [Ralstonia solanacearum]OPK57696.1 hypothetical protein B5J95_08530 [Ralstonia solanacearum]OPK59353.1 hypothetical protein B5S37_04615 [Ralstonia solanacearum]OYQ05201.1 hypothetical protein B7R79_03130 [Ralstonia solanacearum]